MGICEDPYLGRMFELNTYLTGEINLKTVTASEKYHQYAGRPEWNRIGKKMREDFPEDDIGVFLCGPIAIANQLSAMCKKLNPPRASVKTSVKNQRASEAKRPGRFTFFK